MKCNVVRDLLPLYLDQLCEEETSGQIRQHLDGCEACRQRCREMESPIERVIDEVEKEHVSIEPMKKYQKKIKRKNKLLVFIILLSVAVIGILSYLSYGQIKHTGPSFETISQYIRFTHIGKEFAKGNLEPLLSSLAIVGDDPECAYYAKQAFHDEEDALIRDTKEYIRNRYPEYFQGKSLKLRKVVVEYHTNQAYMTRNLLVGLDYEIDGIEYYIQLERGAGEKYYVTQDHFEVSTEPVTYTVEEGDGEIEETDDEAEETNDKAKESDDETLSTLLENRESLFMSLPFFDDAILFLARKTIRECYRECRESGKTLSPYVFMTSLLYTTEEYLKDNTLESSYHEIMREHAEQIIEQNYWIQDMHYDILSYDKEKHMFRYRLSLSLIQVETEEECVLTVECYRHLSQMIVIPGTEKLIGENIPEQARSVMLNLWKTS